MKEKVLVMFCFFNRKEKTLNAVNKLNEQYKNIEFLAIDDMSTDETANELKKIKNVTVITTKGNCFYTGAMRYGMKYLKNNNLKYDYLLLINDDVNFYDGFLKKMIHKCNKNCVLVGATSDDNGNLSYGGAIFNLPYSSDFYMKGPEYKEKLDSFNGNCVLVPYNYFLNTDIMDKHYTHYSGDFDYGLMLKRNGYNIYMYDEYVGICNPNDTKNTYLDKNLSLWKRLKLKHKPKGLPFKEFFYYNYKNFGLRMAIKMNYIVYKNMLKK